MLIPGVCTNLVGGVSSTYTMRSQYVTHKTTQIHGSTQYWHCNHLAITYNRLHLLVVIDFVIVVVIVRWKAPAHSSLHSDEFSSQVIQRPRGPEFKHNNSTNFLQPIHRLILWHSLQPTEVNQRPINKKLKDFSHISEVCLQNNIKAAALERSTVWVQMHCTLAYSNVM